MNLDISQKFFLSLQFSVKQGMSTGWSGSIIFILYIEGMV